MSWECFTFIKCKNVTVKTHFNAKKIKKYFVNGKWRRRQRRWSDFKSSMSRVLRYMWTALSSEIVRILSRHHIPTKCLSCHRTDNRNFSPSMKMFAQRSQPADISLEMKLKSVHRHADAGCFVWYDVWRRSGDGWRNHLKSKISSNALIEHFTLVNIYYIRISLSMPRSVNPSIDPIRLSWLMLLLSSLVLIARNSNYRTDGWSVCEL